ncbi:hypothetical protein PRIPAC_71451, partial [Pristionchus pacificus]|uniref:Uncharacterized protein n=1 Tax=Pristionchus pacificus TaxID=54126 RepID=A0A2A6BRI8_PRIPA
MGVFLIALMSPILDDLGVNWGMGVLDVARSAGVEREGGGMGRGLGKRMGSPSYLCSPLFNLSSDDILPLCHLASLPRRSGQFLGGVLGGVHAGVVVCQTTTIPVQLLRTGD